MHAFYSAQQCEIVYEVASDCFFRIFFLKFCYVTQTTRQLLHEGAIQMNLPTNFEFKKYILDQDTPLAYRILLDKSNMYLEVCLQSSS